MVMKKNLLFGKTLLAALILSVVSGVNDASCAPTDDSIPLEIKAKFGNSVFTVHAFPKITSPQTGDIGTKKRRNVGTAFPLDNQGHIITMSCVVKDAGKIIIQGNRGVNFDAVEVGYNVTGTITVLKANNQTQFPIPAIRSMSSIKPGGKVVFLGIPPGKSLSAVTGVIQSIHESDSTILVTVSGEPGTSGTPVFDETGQIVGILAYRVDDKENPSGLSQKKNYVVLSMEYASVVAKSVIHNTEAHGGWLGVSVDVNGGSIQNVFKASPAEKSGIKSGDTIVEINGSPVSSPERLVEVMSATHSGETVRFKVLRSGEPLFFTVKLSEHPPKP
jgi:serine protease Do